MLVRVVCSNRLERWGEALLSVETEKRALEQAILDQNVEANSRFPCCRYLLVGQRTWKKTNKASADFQPIAHLSWRSGLAKEWFCFKNPLQWLEVLSEDSVGVFLAWATLQWKPCVGCSSFFWSIFPYSPFCLLVDDWFLESFFWDGNQYHKTPRGMWP